MEERQVTVDRTTHTLASPFFVLATQNPLESQGTFPLPEAQLDRFFIKISLGYPTHDDALAVLKRFKTADPLTTVEPVITKETLIEAQAVFTDVYIDEVMYDYIIHLTEATRHHEAVEVGLSPRGMQNLLRATLSYAAIKGRDYVIPDDVKAVFGPVVAHRLSFEPMASERPLVLVKDILESVAAPTEVKGSDSK